MTGEVERTIVQPAADAGRDGRAHRWLYIGGLLVLAGIAVLAWSLFSQQQEIGALRQSGEFAAVQAGKLADQVRSLGATPVVQPAAPAATGATGATGAAGINGVNGTPGVPGKDGQSPPCLATTQQCQGTNGTPGTNGLPGTNGVDGKNGTNGKDGQDGKNGADGTNGKDGQPPFSWTTTYPDGSTQTCTRAAGFDPATPKYTCTTQPPPTSTTAVLPPAITARRRTA